MKVHDPLMSYGGRVTSMAVLNPLGHPAVSMKIEVAEVH